MTRNHAPHLEIPERPRLTIVQGGLETFYRKEDIPDFLSQDKPPQYGGYNGDLEDFDYDPTSQLDNLSIVEAGLIALAESSEEKALIEEDFEKSRQVVLRAHQEFRHTTHRHSHAFTVPMRISRHNYEEFVDEIAEHMPCVKYCSPSDGIRIIASIPPMILDHYEAGNGIVLLMPLLDDMTRDLSRPEQMVVGKKIIDDTASYAHRLGVTTMGLGATIPKLTRYGTLINKPEGLVTTTGHAGTVYLVEKTVEQAMRARDFSHETSIGVLGAAGSIGSASLGVLAQKYPKAQFNVFDVRPSFLKRTLEQLPTEIAHNIQISSDNAEAIKKSQIIVSAVLGTLSLREMGLQRADTEGKVFIDDTQPAALGAQEAREFGATVAWPLGRDQTGGHITTKRITLGQKNGLSSTNVVFGCELETFVASLYPELAIAEPVRSTQVKKLGSHATSLVRVDQFISFGQIQE